MIKESLLALLVLIGPASARDYSIFTGNDFPNATTWTAPFSQDGLDPVNQEALGPCTWWKNKVLTSTPSFHWKRTAYQICTDYLKYVEEGREVPQKLAAAYDFLPVFVQAWEDRQEARRQAQVAWNREPEDSPNKEALRLEIGKLDFGEANTTKLAEDTGLLMVLESASYGYN